MANQPTNENPFVFTPIILDQDPHEKRRVIRHLPVVHQTETLQKFFGATADHLFDPGKGRPINGYVGQKPLWHNPTQDYYIGEDSSEREFYQLDATMVSKDKEGNFSNLLFYPDLINQLRFQGSITSNHNRLFEQDAYAWCPPIDLDKITNFRQYAWLPISDCIEPYETGAPALKFALQVYGPKSITIADGEQFVFWLPGHDDDDEQGPETTFYDLTVTKKSHLTVKVDGVVSSFNYTGSTASVPANDFITFDVAPPLDSIVEIWVYSDFENNVLDQTSADPLALGGHPISSGQRIQIVKDKNTDFVSSDVYIVEGVGIRIELIREVALDISDDEAIKPDYVTMSRGASDGNPWSRRNRWFHVDTISDRFDPDFIEARKAARPIIEYNRGLELFNYGLGRRGDVDAVSSTTSNLIEYVTANPTDLTIDGVRIRTAAGSRVKINDLEVTIQAARILLLNSSDDALTNRIFAITNQANVLTLVLETDGFDPSGDPLFGEIVRVKYGSKSTAELHWNGVAWIASQQKSTVNQPIKFALYDATGVSLSDSNTYPQSNFSGSRLFSYKEDNSEFGITDSIVGLSLLRDNKGDILFENYLDTARYSYGAIGQKKDIVGFYFHKFGNIDQSLEVTGNDWYLSDRPTMQFMVDRFLADGTTRLFDISQVPEESDNVAFLEVWRGRVDSNNNYNRILLTEDVDFFRVDRQILVVEIQENDLVEIKVFNSANPPIDATGHYEIPSNLEANPDNETIINLGKGDFYSHFSDTIKRQTGFVGAEYAANNWRDTSKDPTKGRSIIQHTAPLLKTMLLCSESALDLTSAIRFVEAEYARFKDKFLQKILAYSQNQILTTQTQAEDWIDKALVEINLGKTKDFAFYGSGVAKNVLSRTSTFIPATPSYLGLLPLHLPELVVSIEEEVDGNNVEAAFVKGHDGSWGQAVNSESARVLLALEQRIYDSVGSNIASRERPYYDSQIQYGDGFRSNAYSYNEYLSLLRPSFERWTSLKGINYRTNDDYDPADRWTFNWSSQQSPTGEAIPGHWRGVYEKFYNTQRPDLHPWEMLGFTGIPTWWTARYGPAPYTVNNLTLWSDIESGYIHNGPRKGINKEWERPGLQSYIPVDEFGGLRDPFDAGLAQAIPLPQDAKAEWKWGDIGPVEQDWRRSSNFGFAVATAAYLMKPANFVEFGWDSENLVKVFVDGKGEQWLNQTTMNRPRNRELVVHGERLADSSVVERTGIQQWLGDLLTSRNNDITTTLGDKVRGLGVQLAYKVGGFTENNNLVIASDSFGRVPNEDVSVQLYRSPSIQEESYSGIAIEWTGDGYRIFGYDTITPTFFVKYGDPNGQQIKLGGTGRTDATPNWIGGVYYTVNLTVKYGKKFYRCVKTHNASSTFEEDFWLEVARPQYADGTSLLWFIDEEPEPAVLVSYGSILKHPQDVANLMNGYDRYLKSRGWVFDEVDDTSFALSDWQEALKGFIVWSQADSLQAGDVIAFSPGSNKIKFVAEHGTVQPIEQVVNGVYAIVDQIGRPIESADTTVVRYDNEVTVTSDAGTSGIFGLRLYVSEVEHVIALSNQTIFNDTIYNPLLNIQQPRLRLQGFRTTSWHGRLDAPGFIISNTTLVPNFEKAADDFRRFFDIESMENKPLQDRARANFGYEEREYLNNLLLGPSNQFEFYQGMIQQKGSPTSMRRLLRSNFIRHNKGLKLFEEWAFRVADYGGSEMLPSMEFGVVQNDFKHNPQLFEFKLNTLGDAAAPPPPGITQVIDTLEATGQIDSLDARWVWRPESLKITWPMRTSGSDISKDLPTSGFVKLDEVRWTAPRKPDWNLLVKNQIESNGPRVRDGNRIWYYGIDTLDNAWKTSKYYNTSYVINGSTSLTHIAGTVVYFEDDQTVNEEGNGPVTAVDADTDPSKFYLALAPSYREVDSEILPELLVMEGITSPTGPEGETLIPIFSGIVEFTILGSSSNAIPMTFVPEAGMHIKKITLDIDEAFAEGSSITIGTELYPEEFISVQNNTVNYPDFDQTGPAQIVLAPRDTYYVLPGDTSTTVEMVRVGLSDPCVPTLAEWLYKRASDGSFVHGGNLEFGNESEIDLEDYSHYRQIIQVPIDSGNSQTVDIKIITNGNTGGADLNTITVKKPSADGITFVDLTQIGIHEMSNDTVPTLYPYQTSKDRGIGLSVATASTNIVGSAVLRVEYFYTTGFELYQDRAGTAIPLSGVEVNDGVSLFTWIPTLFEDAETGTIPSGIWNVNDLVEVKELSESKGGNGGWGVLKYNGTTWTVIRVQNKKVDSDILTSAAIYDSSQNELTMILQTYDPVKGFIPGTADRELYYKLKVDPAVYGNASGAIDNRLWGSEQVGRLWWDLSTTRYLDYEIYDTVSGGVEYRWRNWGRLAPGIDIDIYQWMRSPVVPTTWNDYVAQNSRSKTDSSEIRPTGILVNPAGTPYVERVEWNNTIQKEEAVYYFWVKDVAVAPLGNGRQLTAIQVANILENPAANDIPYFAVIDHSRLILGGIKQFVADADTVLKIKWKFDPEVETPHHKQWTLLREQDERNTVDDRLWNKMRDSLVGWDDYVDESGNLTPKQVPDFKLPRPQQLGNLSRPRQSWFAANDYLDGDSRPSRAARSTLVELLNDIFSRKAFKQIWFDWRDLFESADTKPTTYDFTALDLADMQLMASTGSNSIEPGQTVFIENTVEADGFWTLWECIEVGDTLDFKLVNFQKWRMQEGDLWKSVDWYASDWTATDFPSYRFSDLASRDSSRPLDLTLLRGTLVEVENTSLDDGGWQWYVLDATGYNEVARKQATFELSDRFHLRTRDRFGPKEIASLLAANIRPDNLQSTLGAAVVNRDGSYELRVILDTFRTQLLDILQKNEVFFSMVKSAFKANRTVDWAFKTSFLYLGGYSEDLQQSPVAFKDQIDNVIAYLEEVKPYHVKIREYVRRLSYGPDLARLSIIDFDKPVYPDRTSLPVQYRRLDVTAPVDVEIMANTSPWNYWYDNYTNDNYNLSKWDEDWNPIRRSRSKILFDRVSCAAQRGWDLSPWDPPFALYSQTSSISDSLSSLSVKYRAEFLWNHDTQAPDSSKPHLNYYFAGPNRFGDCVVNNIAERDRLLRAGKVTSDNQGTIVTVLNDHSRWMWTGLGWIQFEAVGWGREAQGGAAARVDEFYSPMPGMTQRDDPGLISGCDFSGTVITSQFNNGAWDMFEWGSTGWSSEISDRTGTDVTTIDSNATSSNPDSDILVTGKVFAQPGIQGDHPEESIFMYGRDSLIITVLKKTSSVVAPELRWTKNQSNRWEHLNLLGSSASLVAWNQTNKTLTISTTNGVFPFHDPNNPSKEFLDKIKLSFGYYSSSSHNMNLGSKTFALRTVDGDEINDLPPGLIGAGVRVVLENASNQNERMIGTLVWGGAVVGNEQAAWTGSIQVNISGYVGTTPSSLGTQRAKWNIIPLESFNQTGAIWIGKARFTYKTVEAGTSNQFILDGAFADPSSLAGFEVSEDMDAISLGSGLPLYDGSLLKRIGR